MEIQWGEIQEGIQDGRKEPFPVKAVLGYDPVRFALYNSAAKSDSVLWTLHDFVTGISWFRYGKGWDEAQQNAGKLIVKILASTSPPGPTHARRPDEEP